MCLLPRKHIIRISYVASLAKAVIVLMGREVHYLRGSVEKQT